MCRDSWTQNPGIGIAAGIAEHLVAILCGIATFWDGYFLGSLLSGIATFGVATWSDVSLGANMTKHALLATVHNQDSINMVRIDDGQLW